MDTLDKPCLVYLGIKVSAQFPTESRLFGRTHLTCLGENLTARSIHIYEWGSWRRWGVSYGRCIKQEDLGIIPEVTQVMLVVYGCLRVEVDKHLQALLRTSNIW